MPQYLAIVLAAGKGTRMLSDLPKVLVQVCGRPMIEYVLDALTAAGVDQIIVVVGYRAELVRSLLAGRPGVQFAVQTEQLGTGHAVMACREHLTRHQGPVLVVTGDSPMMRAESLTALLAEFERQPAACLLGTAYKQNPTGLGRILRNAEGDLTDIVEEKDATEEQRRVTEVNMSYYVFRCFDLLQALSYIRSDNSQGEYYLTDCPGVLVNQGRTVRAAPVLQPDEALGINTLEELAVVEAAMAKHSARVARPAKTRSPRPNSTP
ncbi:MAG: glycosyl transferase family 2 [Planctomycetes bacterium RBG_13_63_9]|nr:MAG: glycosyl transferase family 2 [Planctomycetes bacterium RBG_13_63_9]